MCRNLSGNAFSKLHRDSPHLAKASRWNLSFLKHFGREFFHVEPSWGLDVVEYMLKFVFC